MKKAGPESIVALDNAPEIDDTDLQSSSDFRLVPRGKWKGVRRHSLIVLGVLVAAAAGFVVSAVLIGRNATQGFLRVESQSPGLVVRVNGQVRGKTPLFLPFAPGELDVSIGEGNTEANQRVSLQAGERVSLYQIAEDRRLATVSADGTSAAKLSVITQPAGGHVIIDGVDQGVAPVVGLELGAGQHDVVVRHDAAAARGNETARPGAPSTAMVGAQPTLSGGWLRVQAPLVLQIHEGERLIGRTDTERVMLPSGDHTLTLSDTAAGVRITQSVRIVPGQTRDIALQVPRTSVNVNASPWAEVWVDGERIGETPIANHQLIPGSHQFELRHPQLG